MIVILAILTQLSPPFDIPNGSNYVLATLVVGFVISPAISAINRRDWSSEQKGISAFFCCFIAALLLSLASGGMNLSRIDATSIFATFLVVFVMAIGLYRWYYKPSGIADAIEVSTG